MPDPVCLVQWLAPDEYREVHAAWTAYAPTINITLHDVRTKAEVSDAIRTWLKDNPNAQFLYIGAHGDETGFGRPDMVQDKMTWAELRTLLIEAQNPPVVWLGTCKSSSVAKAWSPIREYLPAAWITTFDELISPNVCERMLKRSLNDTTPDEGIFVDQELRRLRETLPGVRIKQLYPASTLQRKHEYVDVDDFETHVGVKFETFLKRQR